MGFLATVGFLPLLASTSEESLRLLLVQLLVIILAARAGAAVARRLRQPAVVGEIIAGIVLGPSVFGAIAPDLSAMVFHTATGESQAGLDASLQSFAQVGLVLLLFLVGIEFDFSHIRRQGHVAAAVSTAGIALPFGLGLILASFMAPRLDALGASTAIDPRSFALFIGTAMSITAIPILGRILIEMDLQRSSIGALVIAAAACDDCVGWTLLAAVSAIARGNFELVAIARMVGATIAFAAFCIFVFRPFALPRLERAVREDGKLTSGALSLVLAAIIVAAWATSMIGIFAIFGSFLLGASLSGSAKLREAVHSHLTDFVGVFFLPIFFTYTGLRTNIGSLASVEAWGWCVAVFAVAVIGKWGGCGLAARLAGLPKGEAACVGVLMNTRALMELIVINIGMQLGVIPQAVFTMLVIMAIGTTLMATPLATWLLRGSQYEQALVRRGFLKDRRPSPEPLTLSPEHHG